MADIIKLLPDSVANQIAAGEVIQRPASAVKEMLENSIDSGADNIQLVIKDSGKTLIQVIDNGCGMSVTDARMSFERHATSKINNADDLFKLKTFGFRGEALASIAAIAQVELKSKKKEDQLGSHVIIEGSVVKSQQPCAMESGTSIQIKNLFFNVPARRQFLKSDSHEMRLIIEELQRVALVNPHVSFTLVNNGKLQIQLPDSNLKQRIINLFGSNYQEKLVPVETETEVVKISGFIGKPESARKTRGEQYFFANNRFIKHPYLNHAVEEVFSTLIPEEHYPSYFLYLEVNPEDIDINIHPTKTEVNFQNHHAIYGILKSAVKQAIGKYSLFPTIDFDTKPEYNFFFPKDKPVMVPGIKVNPDYNPFVKRESPDLGLSSFYVSPQVKTVDTDTAGNIQPQQTMTVGSDFDSEGREQRGFIQFRNKYIISKIKSGLMIIDQQAAHERILYERFIERIENRPANIQQQLFPQTVKLSAPDSIIVEELADDFRKLGIVLEPFGQSTFILTGTPSDIQDQNIQQLIEGVIENYKLNKASLKIDKTTNLARSMAKNLSLKANRVLSCEEMEGLVDDLFACRAPGISPGGKAIIVNISLEEIERRFAQNLT
ncbi:MAG: DNA mismatch repair endonuclease MutL [Chloroflexota bacterium]